MGDRKGVHKIVVSSVHHPVLFINCLTSIYVIGEYEYQNHLSVRLDSIMRMHCHFCRFDKEDGNNFAYDSTSAPVDDDKVATENWSRSS